MRLKLLTAILLFVPGMLFSQTTSVADWFKHPSLSAAAQFIQGYNFQEQKFTPRPLAMLKTSFGDSKKGISADFILDVATGRFLTVAGQWQPVPQIGVRVGLQKMLFLYDNTFAPYMYGMMGYSQATSFLAGYSSDLTHINSRSRDVGISLNGAFWSQEGGYYTLSYAVGVFNGNGNNFVDNNRAKDIHARLVFQPLRQLKISLGAMNGYYKVPEGEPRPNGGHHHSDEDLSCRQRVSAGVWYQSRTLFARAENIYGITDGMHSNGFMAIVGGIIAPRLQLAARVDNFKLDLADPLSASTKLDICFTHHLTNDGTLYYAIQYGHTFYSDPARPGTDLIQICLNIAFLRNL